MSTRRRKKKCFHSRFNFENPLCMPRTVLLRVENSVEMKALVSAIYELYVLCLVIQLCLTLCDPMNCSLPGSSVHGILQTRILEWVVMPFSRGSS